MVHETKQTKRRAQVKASTLECRSRTLHQIIIRIAGASQVEHARSEIAVGGRNPIVVT